MAHALATHAVATATADGRLRPPGARRSAAPVLHRGVVVALGALAVRPQATRVAHAHAALEGAVAVVAFGAVGLRFGLALAVTLEGDVDEEGVLEAHGFDDKCLFLLLRAATSPGLHAERDLDKTNFYMTPVWIM